MTLVSFIVRLTLASARICKLTMLRCTTRTLAQLALLFIKVIVSAGLTVNTLVMPMALMSADASVVTVRKAR